MVRSNRNSGSYEVDANPMRVVNYAKNYYFTDSCYI